MKPWGKYLARNWPFLIWLAVAAILFWPVRGYYVALPSPDSAPFFPAGHRLRLLEQILAGTTAVTPHHLLSLIFPPLPLNDIFYFLDALLIAIGLAWFLRGRDVPPIAAWVGGGILAFAGYSFTLISAGHMGFFHMTAYATFMFGALVRAVRWGSWPHYMLTGILAAWTMTFAPDFGPLMLALAAIYGIWLVCRNADKKPWSQRWKPLAYGLPLAALCFGLGAWPAIRTILTEHVANREAQIAGSTPQNSQPAGDAANGASNDPQARWIFATNWSLHPDEIVEFVAPNLYGTQSGDPKAPYWGKLGRTLGWEEHHQGFPNFRQHTIYLGALQLMLAALAIGVWCQRLATTRHKHKSATASKSSSDSAGTNTSATIGGVIPTPVWLTDIPFWTIVWLVGLLLAFGRHAPLYRLFYSLPYMSLLRAPVKFIRFVELATAILAASGLAAIISGEFRRWRGWLIAAAIGAAIMFGVALWTKGATSAIHHTLEPLRLAGLTPLLQRNLANALYHGAAAFGVAAVIFFFAGRRRSQITAIAAIIMLWLAIDAASVNRRFIQAWDLSAHYKPNAIVKRILAEGGPAPVVANYATPNVQENWFSYAFAANGILNCVPSPQAPAANHLRQLHDALRNDPLRYWELCGARHVILPLQAAKALTGQRLKPLTTFQLGQGQVLPGTDQAQTMVLAEVPQALPYAWLTPAWETVSDDDFLVATATRASPRRSVVLGNTIGNHGDPAAVPGTVMVRQARRNERKLQSILDIDTPDSQLLVTRNRWQELPRADRVTVDGKVTTFERVNHLWLGTSVPAGGHQVIFRTTISIKALGLALLPILLLLSSTFVAHKTMIGEK